MYHRPQNKNIFILFSSIVLGLLVGACVKMDPGGSPEGGSKFLAAQVLQITKTPTVSTAEPITPTPLPKTIQPTMTPTAALSHTPTTTLTPSPSPSPSATQSFTPTAGPNPFLPDLYTLPPSDLVIEIDRSPEGKVLRFSNSIANKGPGVLELWGKREPTTNETSVTQRIYHEDGTYKEEVAGKFDFHPQHDHWHLLDFARYELWTLSFTGRFDSMVGLTDKVSYCLRDNIPIPSPQATPGPVYLRCNNEKQGISVGWVDVYRANIPGQVIDITDLPSQGDYGLRSIVDPENRLMEANETNNATVIYIEIKDDEVRIIDRPTFVPRSILRP